MNTYNVRVFLTVAESQSLSEAARTLYFSQPTVSNCLGALEHELGVQLVIRRQGVRCITLTEAGRDFLPLARQLVGAETEINRFVQSRSSKVLRIGATTSVHEYLLSDVAQRLSQKAPKLEIKMSFVQNHLLAAEIGNCGIDVGFSHSEVPGNGQMASVPLFSERFCILCPADTVLPDRELSAADLDPAFEVVHIMTSDRRDIHAWHRSHFPQADAPNCKPRMVMTVDTYLTDPRSWVILPLVVAKHLAAMRQSRPQIRMVDSLQYTRTSSMLYSKSYADGEVIHRLLACCGEYLNERPYLQRLLPKI